MKKLIFTIILASLSNTLIAQDVIIKLDHTEISAKVLEVGENSIKYKFWDRQQGPTYIIKKAEIFLIVYESGVKEHYGKPAVTNSVTTTSSSANDTPTYSTPAPSASPASYQEQSTATNVVTATNTAANTAANAAKEQIPEERPKYPTLGKITVGFGKAAVEDVSTFGLSAIAIYPFLKNGIHSPEFELGTYSTFSNANSDLFDSKSSTYIVSGALNYGVYLMKSIKISGGVGYFYGWGDTTVESDFGDSTTDFTVNDLFYSGTLEVFLTKGFGLNVRYDEILGLNFGVSFSN